MSTSCTVGHSSLEIQVAQSMRLGQPASLHHTDHSPSHNGSKDEENGVGYLYSECKDDLPEGCKGNEEMDKVYFESLFRRTSMSYTH